ncbi:hypothetical protein A4A49_19132 [Nicotiana attenuata]|uniref:DUF4283 domain-containing protein n=1 Tax=Nicotiana attenuata TaxID=49451 RepID=A0A314L7K1_NICAT|nr:hypothetical protein A4A49_19132 [Nicotiana attenuata]
MQKKRLSKAHTTIQESAQDHIPIAMKLQKGVEVTVTKNRLGTSKIPQGDSGSNNEIPLREDCSPSQGVPPYQKSASSTMEIVSNDQLKNSGDTDITGNGVPPGQNENACGLTPPGARQNDTLISGPSCTQQPIANASTSHKEHVCKVSSKSNAAMDHQDQRQSSEPYQLTGHGAPVNHLTPNQCQMTPAAQETVSHPSNIIPTKPIFTNIQKGVPAQLSSAGDRPNIKANSTACLSDHAGPQSTQGPKENGRQSNIQGPIQNKGHQVPSSSSEMQMNANVDSTTSDVHNVEVPLSKAPTDVNEVANIEVSLAINPNHKDHTGSPTSTVQVVDNGNKLPSEVHPHTQVHPTSHPHNCIKVSSNFERPRHPKKNFNPPAKNAEIPPPTQAIPQIIPAPNIISQSTNTYNKSKTPNNPSPPPPPTITHSYVTRLRARHEVEIAPIQFTSPVITTKQGKPAVILKKEDYMVKFADRYKFTIVDKFQHTMPRMEVIGKSFIAQTELRGGVKIAYFNAKTVYIDLDTEYDHSTVWSKQHMYIQGQIMSKEAWNPIFKPNEDSPIVPIWIMIPELPWHLYYMEILTPLLSPIEKALFLDLASFQKTRGSVVKVKMQIDLTKERTTHTFGPLYSGLSVKLRELEAQKRKENEAAATTSSQANNQQKATENAETSRQNQINKQQEKTKNGGQGQNDNTKTTEHQKEKQLQSDDTTAQKDDWKTQKRKNFKGNSQTKKQQQVYLPKHQANQSNGTSDQQVVNNKSSGMTPVTQTDFQTVNANTVLKVFVAQNHVPQSHSPHVSIPDKEVQGRMKNCQEKLIENQEGMYKDPVLTQPLLNPNKVSENGVSDTEKIPAAAEGLEVPPITVKVPENHHSGLESVLEECPLSRYFPQDDEYRPINSEDKMSKEPDDEVELSNKDEEEQHCDLLLSMHQFASNINDKIWVFWDKEFNAKVLDHDEQQLSLEMTHAENGKMFHLTVISAKCKPVLTRPLWEFLRQKSSSCNVPWCVIGHFSVIASVEEKIGGIRYQMSKSIEFLSMIEDCGLVDLGFYRPKYTWSNGRGQCSIVWKRLDRGLANDQCLEMFPATTVSHLALTGSDHNPLLLELHIRQDNGKKYFKFLNCWVDNKGFLPLVSEVWNRQVRAHAMCVFHQKLKILSHAMSQWSRQEYGDIFKRPKSLSKRLNMQK